MNFLIVLAVVLMVHQGEWIQRFQRDDWFVYGVQNFTTVKNHQPWLPLLLMAGIPVMVLMLILFFLNDYWWAAFVINAVVLLYAIGRGSWRDECDSWVDLFAERDPSVIKQKIAGDAASPDTVADSQIENTWLQARTDVLYHHLDGFYTVVFWFFVAGAPVALFYRLLHLSQQQAVGKGLNEAAGNSEVNWLLWMMEWLPVRVMSMLFCLVGNFTTGFWVLKQILLDGILASSDVLARCADAALFLDGSVDDDDLLDEETEQKKNRTAKMIERMEARALEQKTLGVMRRNSVELQALLQRSEWAFLVVIAILALL